MSACVAVGIEAVDTFGDIEMRDSAAIDKLVDAAEAPSSAGHAANKSQASSLGRDLAMGGATTLPTDNVDHPAHRVRPVKRRARAPQKLDPVAVDDQQVLVQGRSVALGAGGVTEPQAIEQQSGVVVAHPPCLYGRQTARAAVLPDAHAGHGAQSFGDRILRPPADLISIDDIARLGDFPQ